MKHLCRTLALLTTLSLAGSATAAPVRVLYVGGDWKSQLPSFQGKTQVLPSKKIDGDRADIEVEVPALTAVSLTVR